MVERGRWHEDQVGGEDELGEPRAEDRLNTDQFLHQHIPGDDRGHQRQVMHVVKDDVPVGAVTGGHPAQPQRPEEPRREDIDQRKARHHQEPRPGEEREADRREFPRPPHRSQERRHPGRRQRDQPEPQQDIAGIEDAKPTQLVFGKFGVAIIEKRRAARNRAQRQRHPAQHQRKSAPGQAACGKPPPGLNRGKRQQDGALHKVKPVEEYPDPVQGQKPEARFRDEVDPAGTRQRHTGATDDTGEEREDGQTRERDQQSAVAGRKMVQPVTKRGGHAAPPSVTLRRACITSWAAPQ